MLLAPADQPGRVRILGPQDGRAPVRTVPASALLRLLELARARPRREAAALLAAEFVRLDESGIPGIGVKGLLTAHFLKERLPKSDKWPQLQEIASRAAPGRSWQEALRGLGWQLQQTDRGYLLRAAAEPVAIVHAYTDAALFSHATPQGSLPEGLALADCARQGAAWAILSAPQRFRLFQFQPPVGAATGQYLEIDLAELEQRAYAALLAPDSLKRAGWFEAWLAESRRFGEELRQGLEERLRIQALPRIAQGLGDFLQREERADLTDRKVLEQIEEAALTLVFRFIFVLYAEATGHLPIASEAYRPHSASELAADARRDLTRLDARSTTFWDRLTTLVRMVRQGNTAVGVPAYNGSLFAASGFPGGELLERAKVKDTYLAPALAAILFEGDGPDGAGVDFAELQIGHLGAIYEGLLGLKLTSAREPMRYDEKNDRYLPARAGDKAIVQSAELFYQTEAGGRKAGGVFYTRHEFVRHLLEHSLAPALGAHLDEVTGLAKTDPDAALRRLFDFSVVDPAMGSAHFLTAALDMMADGIATRFLAESPLPGLRGLLDTLKDADGTGGSGRVYEDNALLRRLILKRCIYGVDLSPMAVEVANISLWLHSFVPGLSLAYLGSNLKVGDALIGVADLNALRATSPLFTARGTNSPIDQALKKAEAIAREQAAIPDRTPEEVKRSQEKQRELEQVTAGLARCLDLWCAEPLGVEGARWALDMGTVETVLAGNPAGKAARFLKQAQEEARRRRFFHWPLDFPLAFLRERPGFDVVVGNPPWDEVKVDDLRFYAIHDPGLWVSTEQGRRERIQELDRHDPGLRVQFEQLRSTLATNRRFFGPEGGYNSQGAGDLDLFELFCERYGHLARDGGYLGVVLPRSAFLVEGARGFRRWLFKENTVRRVDFILNNRSWAFPIHPQYTIALVAGQRASPGVDAELRVTGPSASLEEFIAISKTPGVSVPLADLRRWTPAPPDDTVREPSWEVPLLPTQAAATLFAKLRQGPRFDQGYARIWKAFPVRELDETNDKKYFKHPSGLPVWKGRSFDQYDPHGAEPAGYARARELEAHLQKKRLSARGQFRRHFPDKWLKDVRTLPLHHARIAFRNVTNRTNSRTVLACLIPPETGLTNAAPYLFFPNGGPLAQLFVLGIFNSLAFDWQARRLVEMNVNFFILNMLCFPPPERTPWQRIGKLAARLSCVDERFAAFARQAGVECGPVGDKRLDMLAEIDALVARAYRLDEADLYTVFEDFTEQAVTPAYRERVVAKFREVVR